MRAMADQPTRHALQGTLRRDANPAPYPRQDVPWLQPNDISAAAGTAKPHHRSAAPHPPATGAVVSFSNVEKRYSATDVALDGISFDIFPGEFVFLVGQSGSGKSTTMRLLIKEAEPTAGEIRVAGRDLAKIPRARVPYYRRNLGVIFQDYKLLPEPHGLRERRLRAAGHGRRPPRDPRQGAGHPAPDRALAPSSTTTPTSSPAASSSASRSPARSSTTRRC